MNHKYPRLYIDMIPTEPRHREAFAFKHPLESRTFDGIGIIDGNLCLTGTEMFEGYSLVKPDLFGDNLEIHMNITLIKRDLAAKRVPFQMLRCTCSQEWYEYTLTTNGVEPDHLTRLTEADLERPGIMLGWQPGNVSIVDGAHRLCRRWQLGMVTFETALVAAASVIEHLKLTEKGAKVSAW